VRAGREHDTTCAKKADSLLPALEFYEHEYQIPTLTNLGYTSLSPKAALVRLHLEHGRPLPGGYPT
jgi:hypothetical protein